MKIQTKRIVRGFSALGVVLVALSACQDGGKQFEISGDMVNLPDTLLVIQEGDHIGNALAPLQIDDADGIVIRGISEQQDAKMLVLCIAVRACARQGRAARGLDVDVQVIHGRHLMSMEL